MTKNELLLAASSLPQKFKEQKGFKQAWFTRTEVEKLIELVKRDAKQSVTEQKSTG